MSKRVVLSALFLLAGTPMLASGTAPLGVLILFIAITLLALPRLGEHPRVTEPRPGQHRG